ncbi:MAG: hypothetical protein ABIR96_01075 [Bdellovibrionota bacterium]
MSHVSVFDLLKKAALRDQLGHGLLLVSPSLETPVFREKLKDLVAFLMCTEKVSASGSEEAHACGRCESCQAFKNSRTHEGVHPDLFWISPETKTGYSVDQIKELKGSLGLARSIASERVVVIESAEDLGASGGAAANALLKLLEEPRPQTRLLLLSSRPEGVLPTIRSRCQSFRVPLPAGAVAASPLSPEALINWTPLWAWIATGFPTQEWSRLVLPPDTDSYFKEREIATEELRGVFWESWTRARDVVAALDVDHARKTLHWFESFETLLASFRFHGQGALQWSAFKSRAKMG